MNFDFVEIFQKKIDIMPVNVVVLAEFELEIVVAAVTLVSKLEAVEAAPEAALSEVVVA